MNTLFTKSVLVFLILCNTHNSHLVFILYHITLINKNMGHRRVADIFMYDLDKALLFPALSHGIILFLLIITNWRSEAMHLWTGTFCV